ncbi:FAD-dependent oxidoreductase [Candidatus Epulonipiscium viviparus]|uniref:oxidoreductase n=1 Tax=Candidatus Epulonipiscium viviparus TaxID=420336 RepID=UPI00016C0210|nr:FAD-dependent oxidoreductase [Candidatus Epulopiscium viviparus]
MEHKYSKLFTPIKIGKLEIKNRYFMAPMATPGLVDPTTGAYNERGIEYYAQRAKGGTGLIVTGICKAEKIVESMNGGIPMASLNPGAFVRDGKTLTERVHAYDAKIFLQLGFGFGRVMVPNAIKNGAAAVAPSPVENRWDKNVIHRELTIEEIKSMIKSMAQAAAHAKRAGFDGVEVHAVHEGYLLDQFTLELFNQRKDQYGGSFENRYRAAVEVVEAIKAECGQDFPVILRYSPKSFIKGIRQGGLPGEEFKELGRDIEEGIKAAKYLVKAGYDALDVDVGSYDAWYWSHPPMYFDDGLYLPFGKIMKEAVDVPIMIAGRVDNPDLALQAIDDGEADMIGLGRPLLSDPQLPNKVRRRKLKDIRPCLSCHDGCMGRVKTGYVMTCAVNPACSREVEYGIVASIKPKKIMVIGGGVAGMEVARVCGEKGYEVDLYEKSNRLGGSLIPGGMPTFKRNDHKLIAWYENQLKTLKVNIHMETAVTKDMIINSDYDAYILGTGATPIKLSLKGSELNNVYDASKVSMDISIAGNEVVIIGAGLVGAELGLWLKMEGKKVTIVEMTDKIFGGEGAIPFPNYDMLRDLLNFNNVKILTETKAKEVTAEGLKVGLKDGSEQVIKADTVITAVGYHSDNKLYNEIRLSDKEVFLLGDAKQVHNIMYAIWDAYAVARDL